MADQTFNVNCGFFDAINYDRTYSADDMNKPYSRLIADGVFAADDGTSESTDLQVVSAGTGMQITVLAGQGIFAHKWFENSSPIVITVPANTTLYPRYDSVIAQVDNTSSGRAGNIVYRTGTAASSPSPPDINTETDVTEYRLANIYVAAGANAINNDAITDLRGSSSCPWVAGLIQQLDTSTLWEQFNTAYTNQYSQFTQDYQNYVSEQREAWEAFLQGLTEDLSVETNVVLYSSVYTATGTVTSVPINIPSYNSETDILQVFINGMLAVENDEYTVDANELNITLENSIKSGDVVNFIVFKSLIGADLESAVTMIRNLDDKLANFMADSGWITFTLESGATAYDSDSKPAVRCIGNRVYLRGAFKNLTTVGNTICTLPVAYRPYMDHVFTTAAANSSGTANDYVTITVSGTDGTIKLTAKSGTLTATDKISLATSFIAATGNTTASLFTYKGSVSTYADLPSSGVSVGDVYMVETANSTYNIYAGDDVFWNGSEWEILNSVISSDDIDVIINSLAAPSSVPVITSQPQSVIVADDGETHTVTFSVVATDATSYQWQASASRGDSSNFTSLSGKTSDTYSFTANFSLDNYYYRCAVTNSAGTVFSDAARYQFVESIAATYTQSGTVYDTDSLDDLKADLVVVATYGYTGVYTRTATLSDSDYTLSGTLEAGTCTITVDYAGATTTFTVTVTAS